jgi:thiol-disulfide isomerase/thioredoxin
MQLDQPAPHFELPDLAGKTHRLSDYRGRIVILNFWSAECPFAERVDRELLQLLAGWGEQVVYLPIAANLNEPPEMLARAAGERGLPLVLRGRPEIRDGYEAQTTPHLFVADATGILRYRGAFDDVAFRQRTPTRPYLKDAVEALLAGRMPAPAETPPYGCAIVRHLPDSC